MEISIDRARQITKGWHPSRRDGLPRTFASRVARTDRPMRATAPAEPGERDGPRHPSRQAARVSGSPGSVGRRAFSFVVRPCGVGAPSCGRFVCGGALWDWLWAGLHVSAVLRVGVCCGEGGGGGGCGVDVREAELVAAVRANGEQLVAEANVLVAKGEARVMRDLDAIWSEIERGAGRIVEKSGKPLTREQAVARYLRTEKGAALYTRYEDERQRVVKALEVSEAGAAQRANDAFTREQTLRAVDRVLKEEGRDAAGALADRFAVDPVVRAAFGAEPLSPVAKASTADGYEEIEREARALLREDASLSMDAAVARAVSQRPELYDRYLAHNSALTDAAPGAPPINSGAGVDGPSPFGSAAGTWSLPGDTVAKADGSVGSGRPALSDADRIRSWLGALKAHVDAGGSVQAFVDETDAKTRALVQAWVESQEGEASKRVAKSSDDVWQEIVEKSGAVATDPEYSRVIDGFLQSAEGAHLYKTYTECYEREA